MIECVLSNIDSAEEVRLRKFMAQPEFVSLLLVIGSQVKYFQAMALREAVQSHVNPARIESSDGFMVKAKEWVDALNVLQRLSGQPASEHFKIASLS